MSSRAQHQAKPTSPCRRMVGAGEKGGADLGSRVQLRSAAVLAEAGEGAACPTWGAGRGPRIHNLASRLVANHMRAWPAHPSAR
jgi:hypothetical protein